MLEYAAMLVPAAAKLALEKLPWGHGDGQEIPRLACDKGKDVTISNRTSWRLGQRGNNLGAAVGWRLYFLQATDNVQWCFFEVQPGENSHVLDVQSRIQVTLIEAIKVAKIIHKDKSIHCMYNTDKTRPLHRALLQHSGIFFSHINGIYLI